VFLVSLAGATNVLGKESLQGIAGLETVAKIPVLTLRHGEGGQAIDNIEALALGPMVDGKPTLIFASDNNFNRRGQITQFLAFSLE
jgi:hypothetical protein